VVEGTTLEMWRRGNLTESSNLSLSAMISKNSRGLFALVIIALRGKMRKAQGSRARAGVAKIFSRKLFVTESLQRNADGPIV
jgi:hypothetical protein